MAEPPSELRPLSEGLPCPICGAPLEAVEINKPLHLPVGWIQTALYRCGGGNAHWATEFVDLQRGQWTLKETQQRPRDDGTRTP